MKRYNVRNLQPKDMPGLIELHGEQNQRDHTSYPLPRMFGQAGNFDPDIALALAVERHGRLTQGIYFQSRIAEMCFAGCDARATAHARHEINAVRYTLASLRYRAIRCLIPKVRVQELEEPMLIAGFKRTDDEFAHFYQALPDIEDL